MYIKNGIAYAGEPTPMVKVIGVRPLPEYKLWVRFNNGEARVFDFTDKLELPIYAPLKDKCVFEGVYIDCGVTVWNDGDIDIAPEYLYEHGKSAGSELYA